ncbi:MAG: hypothetical protein B6D56_03780 [Candidatus Omnitrophica bacterium 4484_70.1]|nr:MAG: hypothetical protein B6D56_03780 [Candidatus Omnitrophica bacterium 4484_70.1]
MGRKYTVIIRKSKLEYVAICLELNVSARGEDLADVEKNIRAAIELYQEDAKEHPEEELIEFLRDIQPEWYRKSGKDLILRPFEVHEVPVYA